MFEGDEENNMIEIYFQPKFQYTRENSNEINNILEVLVPILDEKIYDDLRTQQQLRYYIGCAKK